MTDDDTGTRATQDVITPVEIQSGEAHDQWEHVLDAVGEGKSFLVSEQHRPLAMIVPLEEWRELHLYTDENSPEMRELAALVERLNNQNQASQEALDEAFGELAKTREALSQWYRERQQREGTSE